MKDLTVEAELKEERRCYTDGFVNGGRGYEPRNVRGLLETEKDKGVEPKASRRNADMNTF